MIDSTEYTGARASFADDRRKNGHGKNNEAENRSGFSRLVLDNACCTVGVVLAVFMVMRGENKTDIAT
jgi:hypothetical protein